jgi:hypothetical protein
VRIGDRVYHYDDEDPVKTGGEIAERYAGPKEGMQGRVKVEWECGSATWEYPSDLYPAPQEEERKKE